MLLGDFQVIGKTGHILYELESFIYFIMVGILLVGEEYLLSGLNEDRGVFGDLILGLLAIDAQIVENSLDY